MKIYIDIEEIRKISQKVHDNQKEQYKKQAIDLLPFCFEKIEEAANRGKFNVFIENDESDDGFGQKYDSTVMYELVDLLKEKKFDAELVLLSSYYLKIGWTK